MNGCLLCYGRSGLLCSVVILHKAVCITDVADLRRGEDIGRSVGTGMSLVTYCVGCDLRYTRLDAGAVDLHNQVLCRGCQAATDAGQQKNPGFYHLCNN